MFPGHIAELYQEQLQQQQLQQQSKLDNITAMNTHSKTNKIKDAGKVAYDNVKTQASKIYQAYSVKNW